MDTFHSLGGYPVCEASAAVVVKCPKAFEFKPGNCLLVGDNEINNRLFVYPIDASNGALQLQPRREIPFTKTSSNRNQEFKVSDIEAMVRLSGKAVAVFGSHSRNNSCKVKKKRARIADGTLKRRRFNASVRELDRKPDDLCDRLFGEDRDDRFERVCAAIMTGETNADDDGDDCRDVPSLNVEGAVAIPDDGETDLWIGLRAPLVGEQAVMLRQVDDRLSFEFNAVAFLNLEGFGVRELTLHGDRVWLIAGPEVDGDDEHALYSFDRDDLRDGAVLEPRREASLPNRAEGLVIFEDQLIVLMDGDQPEEFSPLTCKTPSTYIVRPVP